ncbi:hypothetical protein HZ994_01255 [Akkermansiaceae bacterium]|nr:hypothetical protein HZ994_01255 [Akkermansiaceae bacterium]
MSRTKIKASTRNQQNRKRVRPQGVPAFLSSVKKRSHEENKRRLRRRSGKDFLASVGIDEIHCEESQPGLRTHFLRFLLACILLPVCWVTTWTFLIRFSHTTVEQGFWQASQFWYFAVGALVMLGWFWSRIWQPAFLYCYVFGHEVTHAAFVKCFGGRVLDMDWGTQGGYVTTDKTNWVIALSPYFVPFWSVIAVIAYVTASLLYEITPLGNMVFYGVIGATWSFHLTWTLWMIPRDQPDLKDNGTFLSLVLIYFGNLIVLIGLLCLAAPSPVESLRDFAYSWLSTAATWADAALRWIQDLAENAARS